MAVTTQAIATTLVRGGMRALGTVAPPLAAQVAHRIWGDLGRPLPVHSRDVDMHARAVRGELLVDGKRVVTYTWGSGPEVVLLVHGWRSRASRFSSLVRALESPGRTIVSFDAPGNGDSTGTATTILDYSEIIRRLSPPRGFVAIVAHSFGVLATFLAAREGVPVGRIVGIAGMYDANQLVDQFSRQAALSSRVKRGLRTRIERRTFPGEPDVWRRFVAELDPADIHTPLLLVHDRGDRMVDASQAGLIAEAHNGPTRVILTDGLGHNGVLRDANVLDDIRGFLR
ncbi:MAG: alpha/beta fold hydrolase [Pseudolysinimonas sp.]